MKALASLVVLAIALAGAVAFGSDLWVGNITTVGGDSGTNFTTAAPTGPFPLSPGLYYSVQCATDSCVSSGRDAGGMAVSCGLVYDGGTTVTGVKVAANLLYDIPLAPPHAGIAVIDQDGGTANCNVFISANPQ